jgi:hypothetical protein
MMTGRKIADEMTEVTGLSTCLLGRGGKCGADIPIRVFAAD